MKVSTVEGMLEGVESPYDSGIHVFRGIPYALPPTGERRWRPPAPHPGWDGIRLATEFSASCYQERHTSAFVWRREDFVVSEDCLYLNVWAKAGARDLPVMVWFHGGAHTSGQGHSRIFDGTTLAQQDVVLVTINYRLGPFGFLAHPWLADESEHNAAGNYGLMDKLAALEWVQRNIAAFGGNPDRVTVFGQSAGSQSVCSLMVSPEAKGLFHRAIGQSASCVGPGSRQDLDGRERGARLVAETGAQNLQALRQVDPEQILKASASTGWSDASRIVVDGWILPRPQRDLYAEGAQAKIPLLLGSLADEGVELFPKNQNLTVEQLDEYLSVVAGSEGQALKALYAEAGHPGDIQHAISTDLFMAFGMRRWAEYHSRSGNSTHLYFMDHVPPAFHLYMPEDPLLELADGPRSGGAYHSGDLAFVFGSQDKVGLDWREDDRVLSELMVKFWTNFAKTGDPNDAQLPVWPTFNGDSLNTMVLNSAPQAVSGVRRDKLDLMAKAHPL